MSLAVPLSAVIAGLVAGLAVRVARWRAVRRRCGACHGTGVIMFPECTCEPGMAGAWEPHEQHCGEAPCPEGCPWTMATKDEAWEVWREYLPVPPPGIRQEAPGTGLRSGRAYPRWKGKH